LAYGSNETSVFLIVVEVCRTSFVFLDEMILLHTYIGNLFLMGDKSEWYLLRYADTSWKLASGLLCANERFDFHRRVVSESVDKTASAYIAGW